MSFRPAFHLAADHTWINDPNGLFHRDGLWHAFFQNNPYALHWGHMSWGHATSPDLLTWTEHDVAIHCIEGEDAFSGSIVVDRRGTFRRPDADPATEAVVAVYTAHHTDASPLHGIEAQALAISHDGGFTFQRWHANPVLDRGSGNFRDPKVFWFGQPESGHWVMVAVEAELQQVLLHTSVDLVEWTYASSFGPAGAVGGAWECPDLFQIGDPTTGETAWALLVSINPGAPSGGSGTQWFIGDFDGRTFTWGGDPAADPPTADWGWFDLGPDNYASVSYHDATPDAGGRARVVVQGWASNWMYARDTPTVPDGYRHCLTIPRVVSLRSEGGRRRLHQELPVEVLDGLGPEVPVAHQHDGSLDLVDPLGLLTVTTPRDFILELDGVTVRRSGGVLSIHRPADANEPFAPGFEWRLEHAAGAETVRLLIDRCSCELFVVGLTITLTRYPVTVAPVRFTPSDAAPDDPAAVTFRPVRAQLGQYFGT